MFRKLVFRIWILFGIWVLGFGILVPYPEKEIVFLNQLELTLTLPWRNHALLANRNLRVYIAL